MTTIVVGYVPKAEGRAALRRAAEEATLRDAKLVVVNSHRGGRGFDSACRGFSSTWALRPRGGTARP